MSEVCDICAETFTAKTRKKIPCPYDCGLTCCIACVKRQYNENEDDIQCMGCRKSYTQTQLTEMFSQTYIKKEYKERRGEILLNREKAQIPATMPFVEQLVEADKIFEEVRKLRTENEKMRKLMEENNENIYQMMDRISVLREGKVGNSSGGGLRYHAVKVIVMVLLTLLTLVKYVPRKCVRIVIVKKQKITSVIHKLLKQSRKSRKHAKTVPIVVLQFTKSKDVIKCGAQSVTRPFHGDPGSLLRELFTIRITSLI